MRGGAVSAGYGARRCQGGTDLRDLAADGLHVQNALEDERDPVAYRAMDAARGQVLVLDS